MTTGGEVMLSTDEKLCTAGPASRNPGIAKMVPVDRAGDAELVCRQPGLPLRIPPHNPQCEAIFKGEAPFITSPTNGTEYLINKQAPEPLQLSCRAATDVTPRCTGISTTSFTNPVSRVKSSFVPGEGPSRSPVLMTRAGTGYPDHGTQRQSLSAQVSSILFEVIRQPDGKRATMVRWD